MIKIFQKGLPPIIVRGCSVFKLKLSLMYVLNILNITFRQVLDVAKGFCSDDTTDRTVPPLLLLLLSRTCLDLQTATIQNIMSSVDEQFFIDDTSGGLTTIARLGSSFKSMSQELLNHYAR